MWDDLEKWLRYDPGQRGFAGTLRASSLEHGVHRLQSARSVAIATGFYIPAAEAIESDGPAGAVFLARALLRMGKNVILLAPTAAAVACQLSCQFFAPNRVTLFMSPGQVRKELVLELGCDVFAAIEYPGQGLDGKCRNMRGIDISAQVPLLDEALGYAKEHGIYTIAIGDGGNELGCGAQGGSVAYAPDGSSIAAASEAEAVIAAGVSNWGVYVILAALSLLERVNFLPDAHEESLLLERLCTVGVVDGCSCLCQPTVDGISVEKLSEFVQGLYNYVEAQLAQPQSAVFTA